MAAILKSFHTASPAINGFCPRRNGRPSCPISAGKLHEEDSRQDHARWRTSSSTCQSPKAQSEQGASLLRRSISWLGVPRQMSVPWSR